MEKLKEYQQTDPKVYVQRSILLINSTLQPLNNSFYIVLSCSVRDLSYFDIISIFFITAVVVCGDGGHVTEAEVLDGSLGVGYEGEEGCFFPQTCTDKAAVRKANGYD